MSSPMPSQLRSRTPDGIGIGTPRSVHPDARRLTGDAKARGGRDLEDGSRLMRQGRAISGRVATDAASPDVFDERRE